MSGSVLNSWNGWWRTGECVRLKSGVGTRGRGEQAGLKSTKDPFGLGVHAMVGGSNSDTNCPEGVMMMDGVSGRTELSSDKRESPEPFLSPGTNTSSQIFPSTQLVLSQKGGKDCYSTVADWVVSHRQMSRTATQNRYRTTHVKHNLPA